MSLFRGSQPRFFIYPVSSRRKSFAVYCSPFSFIWSRIICGFFALCCAVALPLVAPVLFSPFCVHYMCALSFLASCFLFLVSCFLFLVFVPCPFSAKVFRRCLVVMSFCADYMCAFCLLLINSKLLN